MFTYAKVLGILACFMGAVCVGLNDSEDGSSTSDSAHTVAGDSVALLGALFYGLYTTVLKYMVSITVILSILICFVPAYIIRILLLLR
mgnify:CR=1 FL=1